MMLGTDDADFTGAKERIALSKKGRKEEEKKRKKGIVELIEEAYVFIVFLEQVYSHLV
jgi:hypothetical protein